MPKLTIPELYEVVRRNGAAPDADRVAVAAALAESGGDTAAVGDNGHSYGLWQLFDGGLGAGMTVEARRDPDQAAAVMVPLFNANYAAALAKGYTGEQAARYACIWTERPAGWPNLDSPAANNYAARWREATPPEEPMPTTLTYDPDTSPERQISAWACSIRTATWMLRSLGQDVTAPQMETWMVNAGLVSAADGLEDGSGVALAAWLRDRFGIEVRQQWADWEWLQATAGHGPIGLGGQAWNHWVAVRRVADDGQLLIMNPAPGYRGVYDVLGEGDFARLGRFAAVYIPVDVEAELSQAEKDELAFLRTWRSLTQHEYADDLQQQHDALAALPRMPKAAKGAIDELANLANTLRQGGG